VTHNAVIPGRVHRREPGIRHNPGYSSTPLGCKCRSISRFQLRDSMPMSVMGIRRVIAERDFPAIASRVRRIVWEFLRGWGERDIITLSQTQYDPAAYRGGILKISKREHRALPELNRRVMATAAK
jgi:hypothetical protein